MPADNSNGHRQLGSLLYGSLGIQFRSHVGSANEVHCRACGRQSVVELPKRNLARAD